jgi:hypothetical protein
MQSKRVNGLWLIETWLRFLRDWDAVAAPPVAVAVSRTDILGGGGAGLCGVLLFRVDKIFLGEFPAGGSDSLLSSP